MEQTSLRYKIVQTIFGWFLISGTYMSIQDKSFIGALVGIVAFALLFQSVRNHIIPTASHKVSAVISSAAILIMIGFIGHNMKPNKAKSSIEVNDNSDSLAAVEAIRVADSIAHRPLTAKERAKSLEERMKSSGIWNGWDGSNRQLVKMIKNNMNDPNSFEHVETRYQLINDSIVFVIMKYRGKNAFNATITKQLKAKCDIDGNVLEIVGE